MKDPYSILGVSKSASQKEIKSAYRKLAKQYHPDTNPGDDKIADKFKEISAAYNIIGDEKQRARFDRGEIDASGQERAAYGFGGGGGGFRGGQSRSYRQEDDIFGGGAEDIFSEIFGNFRRGGGRGSRPVKGRDKVFAIEVTFSEAAVGSTRRLTLGQGGKTLDVKVPAGIEDGKQIRLKGQGDPGAAGGPPGDILINVTVKPSSVFVRDGDNVIVELPVSLPEAVLGAKVPVPTVDGTVNLKIPAGSNTGSTLRLKGKGIMRAKAGTRGDQLVRLKVVLPETQDEELQDWVSKWSEGHQYDARSKFAGNT
ncbi:DnaJ C-terminal domain-containing protein [Sneathiella chinensis]|uniref:Molecular chaperone DnaJ n=1 Tax=Sneathiella chinensis TaxID=349750 RepID=A0ABQ5U396_9PROT|nr:J domain-containing protein [Sneathiella chinensis]GLQ06547.1 molecular chaperone DnaJ [Sneathiella chinensis]